MIAAIDIGNTNTKLGLFDQSGYLQKFNFATDLAINPPKALFEATKIVLCSVVPEKTLQWQKAIEGKIPVHVASVDSPWGFKIDLEHKHTVGVDRLANIEGALSTAGAVLVVDIGTATKIDVLEGVGQRVFSGGVIAAGPRVAFEALVKNAAQLSSIDWSVFSPVVGYNTEMALRSGVVHCLAAMVDGMVLKIKEERAWSAGFHVLATGGDAGLLKGRSHFVTQYRPELTLEGLYAIGQKL